jgi:hypothetical protein
VKQGKKKYCTTADLFRASLSSPVKLEARLFKATVMAARLALEARMQFEVDTNEGRLSCVFGL